MTITTDNDKLAGARSQGQAQYESIAEMVARLNAADDDDAFERDEAERAIHEDALSVEVRSDWHVPGGIGADDKPSEFRILLCTGGPACQIRGDLNVHGEPKRAYMQVQDWFTPWTDFDPRGEDVDETLLAYARCFYFGE